VSRRYDLFEYKRTFYYEKNGNWFVKHGITYDLRTTAQADMVVVIEEDGYGRIIKDRSYDTKTLIDPDEMTMIVLKAEPI
jgi:hypothetical protein